MKTLKELIEAAKCRKGPAVGTTKRGAFWLACEPVKIRSYGGDGIGNSGADCKHFLELRHYRSGEVRAMVRGHYWHQNGAGDDTFTPVEILGCTTVEQVIVVLKGSRVDDGCERTTHVYSDSFEDSLTDALASLGLPTSEPSPDEVSASES